jgi:hypothetical protein
MNFGFKLCSKTSDQFILSFSISRVYGLEVHLGWWGFWLMFGNQSPLESMLESLPSIQQPASCMKCGSKDFTAYNVDHHGNATDCDHCGDYPGGPQ